jgi:GTP-binding protein HflX
MVKAVESAKKPLSVYLVEVRRTGVDPRDSDEYLDELEQLVRTFGVPVVGSETAVLRDPNAKYLLGEGKVRQIAAACQALNADVIVIDDELSPSQQRNWEGETGLAVIDRREVILGIFADRAQTREARLQVALARAEYSLPRLARAWTHLERQRGGGGARGGAGEMQIEIDRRLLRDQIRSLKRDLEHVKRVRATQRKARLAIPLPTAALVGYTNAGKSSLLNALTGADVLEEDKLFATLDPTTRKVQLPNGQSILLTDTVGFIRKLPHDLVDAFKATLEEAQLATLIVHVLDASHPHALAHRQATEEVLDELGVLSKPTILVLNKVDLVEDRALLGRLTEGYRYAVSTSTRTREGFQYLTSLLTELSGYDTEKLTLRVPAHRYDIVSLLHREGNITRQQHEDSFTIVDAELPVKLRSRVAEFIVDASIS